jgi:hypothetical protein
MGRGREAMATFFTGDGFVLLASFWCEVTDENARVKRMVALLAF